MLVKIKQEHIDKGIRYKTDKCPLAIGINISYYQNHEATGDLNVNVWDDEIFIYDVEKDIKYLIKKDGIPEDVLRFRLDFDSSKKVYPFEFELDLEKHKI